MKKLSILILLLSCTLLSAQLSINSVNTNFLINFDQTTDGINNSQFNGSGFSPSPDEGQINSNGIIISGLSDGTMEFGDAPAKNDFSRGSSSGGKTTGGIYAFMVSVNNYALGVQPGGNDFTPGAIILKVKNNTGTNISEISISYNVLSLNNEGRSSSLNFAYSLDNENYTNIDNLNYATSADASNDPDWVSNSKSTIIKESINNMDYLYLKWYSDDIDGSGSRDELAIDNINIEMNSDQGTPTGIEENTFTTSIYPNPFTEKLNIKSNNLISQVTITNIVGNIVLLKDFSPSKNITLITENLKSGIYLLKIRDKTGNVRTQKIVK